MDRIEALTDLLLSRVFLEVEASGRHVHLTEAAAMALFGHGLTALRPLSQPGQFVCKERVSLRGPKGELHKVAVLGPCRRENQVELSLTDCVTLGISAPVRLSGRVEGSPGITLLNGERELSLERGVIVAQRHIHMHPEDAARRGIADGDRVRLQVFGSRPAIFEQVPVRVHPNFATCAHLDYDEANACGLKKGGLGRIL